MLEDREVHDTKISNEIKFKNMKTMKINKVIKDLLKKFLSAYIHTEFVVNRT